MRWPKPVPGLVIRYAYVWRREHDEGRDEGRKNRPCAIVLTAPAAGAETRVYVLPVTHTAPQNLTLAIELPARVKQHLGLDDQPSWIMLDEINDFLWPGYDLRPIPGSTPATIEYGHLPPRLFDTVRTAFLALARARRVRRVPRG